MSKVTANLAMSIDGFIAAPDDGCDDLFGFYDNGSTELRLSDGWPPFHMDEPSLTLFREAVARISCHVMGRRHHGVRSSFLRRDVRHQQAGQALREIDPVRLPESTLVRQHRRHR